MVISFPDDECLSRSSWISSRRLPHPLNELAICFCPPKIVSVDSVHLLKSIYDRLLMSRTHEGVHVLKVLSRSHSLQSKIFDCSAGVRLLRLACLDWVSVNRLVRCSCTHFRNIVHSTLEQLLRNPPISLPGLGELLRDRSEVKTSSCEKLEC